MSGVLNKKVRLLFFSLFIMACSNSSRPSVVKIVRSGSGYALVVNDQPFVIKGAGINWADGHNFKALHEAGGNAFRTWRTDNLKQELDSASKYGLMIAVGIDLGKELHGFDYNNEQLVSKQFEEVKAQVLQYKDHPNVLCWVVGNELNLLLNEAQQIIPVNPKAYDAVNQIADFIHETDPCHPVTTALASVHKQSVDSLLSHCPNLDFLSFQVYGELEWLPEMVRATGYKGPFMITEFGPKGHWEVSQTSWGRPIEETNAEKGRGLAERINKGITMDRSGQNIGAFAFEWGQKQERTPTWYGMFLKSGESSARVEELTYYWKGAYPSNRAPLVDSLFLNGKKAKESVQLVVGSINTAKVFYRNLEQDDVLLDWRMMKEVVNESLGGAFEEEPDYLDMTILEASDDAIKFLAPSDEGEYRLYLYVFDTKGKAGTANFPFYVKDAK